MSLERCGLVGEDGAGQVQIKLGRLHRAVTGAGHEGDRRFARGCAVGQRAVPGVVERTDVVGDPGRLQRRAEFARVPLVIDLRAPLRVAEDELVVALEGRALELPFERRLLGDRDVGVHEAEHLLEGRSSLHSAPLPKPPPT